MGVAERTGESRSDAKEAGGRLSKSGSWCELGGESPIFPVHLLRVWISEGLTRADS